MKKKLTIISLAVVTLAISASCKNREKSTEKIDDFELQLLFEKDGCKVYRFVDGNSYVYWSDCSGNMQKQKDYTNGKVRTTIRIQSLTN